MSEKNKKIKKVGNVDISYLKSTGNVDYEDGYEDELLSIFTSDEPSKGRKKALQNNPSWPLYYHLSPARGALLDWYQFKKGASVLEVGSGCGAITETLTKKDVSITSIELTEKRAKANAYRNKKAKNLKMIVGNLDNFNPKEKFDYLVCVGVLEYAGMYISSRDPYGAFLSKLSEFLKPGGILLLAIENQLGMKYLSGAREDHTQGYYDGINDYPQKKLIRTFGRVHIEKIISNSGFESSYFYYPFPDYKFPFIIYSDDYFPGKDGVRFPRSLLPTIPMDGNREFVFSEAAFVVLLEKNNLFRDMSNSFLIESRKSE